MSRFGVHSTLLAVSIARVSEPDVGGCHPTLAAELSKALYGQFG